MRRIALAAVVLALSSTVAFSQNLPTKAPAQNGCPQAVDGVNGKLAGLGGSFADHRIYGGLGSVAVPLGCEFGAEFDATATNFDSRFLGAVAGHLFWRDPAKALLGVYGSYTYWDQLGGVRIGRLGPEGELYIGRWTLQGVTGVEFGNNASGMVNGLTQTYDIKTRVFDQTNLAYYLTDDFKAYVGQRYLVGKHAVALGGEYGIPIGHGVMAALFAEGRIGEGDNHGVWGGIRFYFGQKDKTLIRRQREDDPNDWNDGGVDGGSSTGSTTTTPPTCGPGYILVGNSCFPIIVPG
jgi:hypothetical protein